MKKYLVIFLLLAVAGVLGLIAIQPLIHGGGPAAIEVITTPTTVTLNGLVILNAIHTQSKLETVSMVLANDMDISRSWGLEGACQESLTYLGYYTVTAGVDLQINDPADIILKGNGNPAQTAVTIRLPPAQVLHVELDTQRSRIVHSQASIISQLCGTQLPAMVMEAQANLRTISEASAREHNILQMAQDQASFELKKVLLLLGYTDVTFQFFDTAADQ